MVARVTRTQFSSGIVGVNLAILSMMIMMPMKDSCMPWLTTIAPQIALDVQMVGGNTEMTPRKVTLGVA